MAIAEKVFTETKTLSVLDLPWILEELGPKRELFDRFFKVSAGTACIDVQHLSPKLANLCTQPIIRIYDRFTHGMVGINAERSKRPVSRGDTTEVLREIVHSEGKEKGKCPFCDPDKFSPRGLVGKIVGESCCTTANLFPFGVNHELIVFNKHHPMVFPKLDHWLDRLSVVDQWMEKIHQKVPEAIYPAVVKNTLRTDGASIPHGHMQMKLEKDIHEGGMEQMNAIYNLYRHLFGGDYFEDLFQAYRLVGLGIEKNGVKIMPALTPVKEDEVFMITRNFDQAARETVYDVLRTMVLKRGDVSHNIGIGYPPMGYDGRFDINIPTTIGFVARAKGDIARNSTDMAGSEVPRPIKTIIVASDVFSIQRDLEQVLG